MLVDIEEPANTVIADAASRTQPLRLADTEEETMTNRVLKSSMEVGKTLLAGGALVLCTPAIAAPDPAAGLDKIAEMVAFVREGPKEWLYFSVRLVKAARLSSSSRFASFASFIKSGFSESLRKTSSCPAGTQKF